MTARRHVLLALIAVFACMGASHRTPNFVVHAPTQEIAQRVAQYAEHYRREKAIEWLGQEMPQWPQPCPIYVKVTMGGPQGATSFNFGRDQYGHGAVLGQKMEIEGPLDRLLSSVLPHEITHTVFAYYFRQPVPRWADEGGSVLSEDDVERVRHDKLVRNILNSGQQIPMRTLFGLRDYPQQVVCLYAQGYSIANYLVHRSDKQTFLHFVAMGMQHGWDRAAWTYFQHRSVEELEETWLKFLRDTKGQDHLVASKNLRERSRNAVASAAQPQNTGTVVRMTVPPSEEMAPVIRGQNPTEQDLGQRYGQGQMRPTSAGSFANQPAIQPASRPGYLPDPAPAANRTWQSQGAQPIQSPQGHQGIPVRLGPPQFGPPQSGVMPAPGNVSPVGYPQ